MSNKNITFLEHLTRLKSRIDIIQQKTLDGVLEFFGKGVYISFNFRALPNSWKTAGSNSNRLSVTVVDCRSTTIYLTELNGNKLLTTRVLTNEDKELLSNLYEKFREVYTKGVEYLEPNVYYIAEPKEFLEEVIKSVSASKS